MKRIMLTLVLTIPILAGAILAGSYYTIGSDKSEVRQIQGSPDSIDKQEWLGYELWWYGSSNVKISTKTGKVIEWSSSYPKLRVRMAPGPNVTTADYYTVGSHKDDVLRLQGTPENIDCQDWLGYELWWYGSSNVKISAKTSKVIEWSSSYPKLRVKMSPGSEVTTASYYTRDSHRDDVLRLQGTPDNIDRQDWVGYELWWYGSSNVKISTKTNRVMEWSSSYPKLKVRLEPGSNVTSSAYYTRGSHKDDVLRLQGTPDNIDRQDWLGCELWWYGSSNVRISNKNDRVIEWSSSYPKLLVRMEPGNMVSKSDYFSRGSHRDDILRLQGTPDNIDRQEWLGYELWWYGSSNVKISLKTKRIIAYNDYGNLSVEKENPSKETKNIAQHYQFGDVTLYYDENSVYMDLFSFDVDDSTYYGVVDEGVALFFSEDFQPLHVSAYWQNDGLVTVPTSEEVDQTWFTSFSSSISHINISGDLSGSGTAMSFGNMTFYDLIFDDGESISGTSMEFDPITFDDFYSSYGVSVQGSRIQIGDFTFGDWSTSYGTDISGTSTRIGNTIFHDYQTSDGQTITGSTIEIGNWQFIDLNEW